MADESAPAITRAQQAGLILVMMAAFTEALTVAFNIGLIMTRFGASGAQAGFVATAQGLCVAIAALTGTRLITRYSARTLVAIGLVLVAAGNALALMATSIAMMAACQALAGLGTGLVVCVVMATAARTKRPEMTYGWINASVGAFLSILALTVPKLILFNGFTAAYGFYALLAAVATLCLPAIPNSRAPSTPKAAGSVAADGADIAQLDSKAGWIALVGMGIFYFAIAGMGAFIERIGVKADVALATIGHAFFVGGILTIVGPIAAGMVGARFGSTRPLVLIGGIMCATAFGLSMSGDPLGYLVSIPVWVVLPAIITPSFLGGLAVVDPSGRLNGAQPAFATLGGSMGPMTAGAVVDAGGFMTLGWFVIAVLFAALVLMSVATLRADRMRTTNPSMREAVRTNC